ncbi:MAG: DUF2079 domain-containing protein, partial [Chloroflexota bacterium]|nr:DUF2079 domain-containing protein [Chloroflexota bacterium]
CALVIARYAGGASPFVERFASATGGAAAVADLLTRDVVMGYAATLLLAGGWLAAIAPLAALPVLPSLTLNALASSPWMASGKAHYSALVLPFVIAGAAAGLGRIARWADRRQRGDTRAAVTKTRSAATRWTVHLVATALVLTSGAAHLLEGAGPPGKNFVRPVTTDRSRLAAAVAADLAPQAGVSASSSLVPHVSRRARVYVFPAIEDAEYIFLDVTASPAPTSVGDVFLRVRDLLRQGEWTVRLARDGILLLARTQEAPPTRMEDLPAEFYTFVRGAGRTVPTAAPRPAMDVVATFLDGDLDLLGVQVIPSPSGALEPDGARGVVRSRWRLNRPLPATKTPELLLDLGDGRRVGHGELATLWWYPPDRWAPGEVVTIDVPGVPMESAFDWRVTALTPAIGSGGSPAGDDQAWDAPPDPEPRFALGELVLAIHADPWRLRLQTQSGDLLWEEASDESVGFRDADGAVWRARRLHRAGLANPRTVRLIAESDDPLGRLIIVEAQSITPRAARLTISPSEPSAVVAVGGSIVAGTEERFVGFGERFDGVNQRGKLVDIWADDRVLAGYGASTYAPLPLLISSHGYGFALERFERARFDLAASRADRWSWEQDSATASIVLSVGPSLRDLVQRHVEVTGPPPLPPIWAFGVWKTAVGGQDDVLDEARRLRQLGVPISAMFTYDAVDDGANIGWPSVNYAGRKAGPYPDHAAFTAGLHQLGIKALNYFKADFHADRPGYDEPAGLGHLVRRSNGEPYVHPLFPASWLDFTSPRATTWWRDRWERALTTLGYDGGMLDVGEILPEDAHMWDGTRGAQSHNRYPLLYARSAWEHASSLRPDGDFVLFARSGALGAQRFQSLQWPGDARMEWDGSGGLQSLVPAALSFGLGGFPYFHAEVAGYVQAGLSPGAERELWLRWLQLATWTSTLRDHYGDHPTDPIDLWRDGETLAAFRDAARVHNSLVPYLYTQAQEATRTGLPLMRFLPLEVPDDPRAWREEQSYFLGPQILVAPVVEPGATTRTLYLPAGDWVDYWTDALYPGGQEVTVAAPLDGGRAPVFVRAGTILPLAADFDTLASGQGTDIRVFAGDLIVRVIPGGGASSFTLYDGTRLEWDGAGTLRIAASPHPRSVELRAPGGASASGRIDGEDEIRIP